jgi:hypothetical protein
VASITHEDICVVVNKLESGLVELSSSVLLGNGKTNSVSKTLAERASGDLNAGGIVGFRVTGGDAVDVLKYVNGALGSWGSRITYSEVLQVINCEAETGKVEESILKHASVAVTVRLVSYVTSPLVSGRIPALRIR